MPDNILKAGRALIATAPQVDRAQISRDTCPIEWVCPIDYVNSHKL